MYKLADGSTSNGYKEGDRFLVVSETHYYFDRGDEVILAENDGSGYPYFQRQGEFEKSCSWNKLTPISKKKFTKADLKDGMVVTYRDGSERIFFDGEFFEDCTKKLFRRCLLGSFDCDLTSPDHPDLDIMSVSYMKELLWGREEEETPEQKEIKRLEAVIKEAQDALNGITKG